MKNQTPTNKTRSALRWSVAGIVGLFIVALGFVIPEPINKGIEHINTKTGVGLPLLPVRPFRLGLDLRGGVQLVYQADIKNIAASEQNAAVEGVRDVIERRVNGMGVGEPVVQTSQVEGIYRINVELPGVTDVAQAIKMIGETPILEFKEKNTEPARDLTEQEKKDLTAFNAEAKKQANATLTRLKKNESFDTLATQLSQDEISKNNRGYMGYISSQSIYPTLYDWAKANKEGAISQTVIESGEGYNLLKRGAERAGVTEVKASHILICYLGAQNCAATMTKEEARAKAQQLYDQANASNFAQLAKDNTTEEAGKTTGGDLGWFTTSTMVTEFAQALSSAKKGDIIGPVETAFGYHIIYKQDERVTQEYEISRILFKTKTATDIVPVPEDWKATGLSGKQLQRAEVTTDPKTGTVMVSIRFNAEGTELFREITTRNLQKPVAIFLDGEAISVPNVSSVISDGNAVITGSFNLSEARLLAQRLNAGALPVPVELVSRQGVEASLGADSLARSVQAGIYGAILIAIFMVAVYRLPGLLSAITLGLYIVITLATFKLFGITVTLAGIAGFIMSMGVAVDANVLIFERLKEELQRGKSLKLAVEEGFMRAWTSIRDGNLSTVITCLILIWLGTSFVKGFAVTLVLGIAVSLFTAITITRVLLRFVAPWFNKPTKLFPGYVPKETPTQK